MKRILSLLLVLCLVFPVLAFAELDEEELTGEDIFEEIDLDEVPEESSGDSGAIEMTAEMAEELQKDLEAADSKLADIDTSSLYINPNLPDNVINILLLGVDTREDTLGEGDHTVKRADVQLILSVNTETGDLKLTSIPRDTLITNPANGKLMPITNAYTSFDETVYQLTKTLWENIDALGQAQKNLKGLTPQAAVKDIAGLELHNGAKRYYKEIGVIK